MNFRMKFRLSLAAIAIFSVTTVFGAGHWSDVTTSQVASLGKADIATRECRLMRLDFNSWSALLRTAPAEGAVASSFILGIPLPDGSESRFALHSVPIVHPAMQAKYPGLGTWAGFSVDEPGMVIHLDVTYQGFHAMVLSTDGRAIFIDPYNRGTTEFYKVYYRHQAIPESVEMSCGFDGTDELNQDNAAEIARAVKASSQSGTEVFRSSGATLRTYRCAIACTGEYATFHGGTVTGTLSAIVTSLNRVSGVYELELAIRMTLVPNNDTLIFLNASTDPYSNNNGGTMLTQNQQTVVARIGTSNYDIGHVFSTGGGGIAGLGVICNASQKARGVTGLPTPVGDPFDIDYVAHEMGHQFGANHTFNSNQGSCAGNGNSSTAYEPGSGTTIMAYAGICSPHNTQGNSDAYFHTISYDEIMDYTTLSTGGICPVSSATGNTPPVINSIGLNHAIPYQTPFVLEGAATDADGDPLTYCWEQFDLGPAGSPTSPSGNAPLFRSFLPSVSPVRYFPRLVALVNNANSLGERLPTYARTMNFRLTVRDGKLNGGGVTYEEVLVELDVINTGAPFVVTAPNTLLTWPAGTQQNVTWNVSGTDLAPINAANVDIFLSTDGGYTYPILLASGVPNNGLATVTVPSLTTNTARVMVRGAGNVFFDISNTNFIISNTQGVAENGFQDAVQFFPNPGSGIIQLSLSGDCRGEIVWQLYDLRGRMVKSGSVFKNAEGGVYEMDLTGMPAGIYSWVASNTEGRKVEKLVLQ
jgi:hypothetical protein